MNPEYRKLNQNQINVLKKYDYKYGDGHGHLMITGANGHKLYLDEHEVNEWFITV